MSRIKSVLSHEYNRVIDNRKITMVDALTELLSKSKHLDMAVGYFYLSGFKAIEPAVVNIIERNGSLRILMGNQTTFQTGDVLDKGYILRSTKDMIAESINNIKSEEEITIAHILSQWIAEKKVEVKIYTGEANYFHAKSYLMYREDFRGHDGYAIVGSSNFSESGLLGNTELNTVSSDNFSALSAWFEEVWTGDEVSDFSLELLTIIDNQIQLNNESQNYLSTEETYLTFARYFATRVLQPIDGSFMEGLYLHQQVGVAEIKQRLDQFGTAILCDGVGLGKTRTAAASICAVGAKSALILASRKLHNQWKSELRAVGVSNSNFQLVSKEEIGRYSLSELKRFLNFDLIVVDEAHIGLKNSGTKIYRNLSYLKEKSNEKDIRGLLLTATPWNNSRSDVFYLGRLFLKKENIPSHFAYYKYLWFGPRKAAKAIELDDRAFNSFWRDLFLQRTKKTYGGNDVTYANREFPVIEIKYEPKKESAFLANSERIARLQLSYMNPIRYVDQPDDADFTTERLKLMFLKRADSSWPAFRSTLDKILEKVKKSNSEFQTISEAANPLLALQIWYNQVYDLYQRGGLFEIENIVMEEEDIEFEIKSYRNKQKFIDKLITKINQIKKKEAKRIIQRFLHDTENDIALLTEITLELEDAFKRKDEKYEKIVEQVQKCLVSGEKVLLVTQFRDTALAYYKRLVDEQNMTEYNMGLVTGVAEDVTARFKRDDEFLLLHEPKETVLERFSPRSKERPEIFGTNQEIQLVIGTETLSIGQNLQDCTVIMNIDLPYNPMNLEQRIGRIDRPRQDGQVSEIKIYSFPSMPVIEAELKMTERLQKKLEGIYKDTQFDDLILPEYREFLQKILQNRQVNSQNVEELISKTIQSTVVPITADEHSVLFLEAQKRLREAIEKANERPNPITSPIVYQCSASKTTSSTVVIEIILNDVNGQKIDNYLKHIRIGTEYDVNLSIVEKDWFEACDFTVLSEGQVSPDLIIQKRDQIIMELQSNFLPQEVQIFNNDVDLEGDLEEQLVDTKVKKVISEIKKQLGGSNRAYISNRIKQEGYDPRVVRTLVEQIQFLDRRYDEEKMLIIDELYQNLDLLWDDFKSYYTSLIESDEDVIASPVKRSVRKASLEHCSIEWVVGNIGIIN